MKKLHQQQGWSDVVKTWSSDYIQVAAAGEKPVEFPVEGVTLSLRVTRVGEGLYRLENVPFGIESAGFRDVVEAELVGENRLRVMRVVEPSGWTTVEFELTENELTEDVLSKLEELGGIWQPFTEDRLTLCIPPGKSLEVRSPAAHLVA